MSFYRVSSNYSNDNMKFYNQRREADLSRTLEEQANQRRIQDLRDDPLAAAHSARYQSLIKRNDRFQYNVEYSVQNNNYLDNKMQNGMDILHKMRELAIRGANSTLNTEDRQNIASEVDELMVALLDIANTKDGDGNYVFSGTKTANLPFKVNYSRSLDGKSDVISQVDYMGNSENHRIEIDENKYADSNLIGSEVFWAENQRLHSQSSSLNYSASEDSKIKIDGKEIEIKEGENVYSIMNKINSSQASVKSSLDPVTNGLIVEGTTPHKIFLEDGEGTVLQDLGLINNLKPPYNLNPTTLTSGGSIFDIAINLRDALRKDNVIDLGGSSIKGLDQSIENFLYKISELGSRTSRLEFTNTRLSKEKVDLEALNSKNVDVDLLESVNRFKKLQTANEASLSMTAKVYNTSLLNFLR